MSEPTDLFEQLNAAFAAPSAPAHRQPGRPMSIRLTRGAAQQLRAITGRPAGEVIRTMVDAYIERARLERERS